MHLLEEWRDLTRHPDGAVRVWCPSAAPLWGMGAATAVAVQGAAAASAGRGGGGGGYRRRVGGARSACHTHRARARAEAALEALAAAAAAAAGGRGLHVARIAWAPLRAPLLAPFSIASTTLCNLDNVAVRVELSDGSVGHGECACLPPVTTEDAARAASGAEAAAAALAGCSVANWQELSRRLATVLSSHNFASTRAGVEVALLDALAHAARTPLHAAFGGREPRLRTDITVPICVPSEAEALARAYAARGFDTLKTKTGGADGGGDEAADATGGVRADVERMLAIVRGAPDARLVVDANCGYSGRQTEEFLASLDAEGIVLEVLEQPTARDDWDALAAARLSCERRGIKLAVDEQVRDYEDARRVIEGGLADVINIKLAKSGVGEAMRIAELAKRKKVGLMLGGMVETRLQMGFGACLASGLGGFDWVDLDTPLLLAQDPIAPGGIAPPTNALYDLTQYDGHGHGMVPLAFGGVPAIGRAGRAS